MSDNFNAKGELSLSIQGIDDLNELITALGYYNEHSENAGNASDKLERNLVKVAGAARDSSSSMAGGAADIRQYADGFEELTEKVTKATEAIRLAAQEHVVKDGRDPLGDAASKMSVKDAEEYLAILKAQSITVGEVSRQVLRTRDEEVRATQRAEEVARREAEQTADLRRRRAAEVGQAIQRATEQGERVTVKAEEAKRAAILETSRVAKQVADEGNRLTAQMFQESFTDPKSYLGQAKGREGSYGLKASETSWAQEAKAIDSLNLQYDAHVRATDQVLAKKTLASQQTNLYNRYLWEEEQANLKAAQAVGQHEAALPRLRYALYDVAQTAGVFTAAIGATAGAVLAASGSYESSFTDVERTTLVTSEATERLRGQLMGLTREIPEAWGNITEIAAVGAQLNIADQNLAAFTETTTRFSTVTGISAETSAMAFGSLGQLLGIAANDYERVGSAIAYVGINSVATDEEIIKMSNRLAASAANAGMTAQEVIALSGALASLRIAPERAQGVMEIYFRTLNKAIAEGGDALNTFSRYSGVAVENIAQFVEVDPAGFFRELSAGLGTLDPVSLTLALDELGLSGIRAGEVFTRVSGNLEVFDKAMVDSNQAWEEGTHLLHAYSLVVDDLNSKWQITLNAITELGASIGNQLAPAAKAALDIIAPMLHALTNFVNTPVGKWAVIIATALGGVAFALAGIIATGALFIATMAAMKTAVNELNIAAGVSIFSLRGMRAALQEVSITAGMSARSIGVFKIALASTGIGLAVVLLGTLATAFMNTANSAEGAFDKYLGSAAGLTEALAADTQAYQEAVTSGNTELANSYSLIESPASEASIAIDDNRAQLENASAVLGIAAPAYESAAGAVDTFTAAIGENTIAWIQNTLFASEEFQKLASSGEFVSAWEAIGADFTDAVHVAALQGRAGVANYFGGLAEQTNNSGLVYAQGVAQIFQGIIRMFANFGDTLSGFWSGLTASLNAGHGIQRSLVTGAVSGLIKSGATDTMNNQFREMTLITSGAANQARLLAEAANSASKALSEGANAGRDFGGGVGNGPGGAGRGAKEAQKEVRLLKDYVSDLEKVWSRAFEIRFSGQQTIDDVTSKWSKMWQEIDKANDAIRKYQAEMGVMRADRDTMEYWLKVAENYGDTIRANELRAKIAEMDNKLAETQKKLTAEQEKTNKTLVGNSDAAIKNRGDILNLVSSYQDHVAALANSGLSQDELKAKTQELRDQFIQQATEMGYSRAEVELYAKAFDDVSFAIKHIPRDITVEIKGLNPALAALREIQAAADAAAASVGGIGGGGVGGPSGIGGPSTPTAPAPQKIPYAPVPRENLVDYLNNQIRNGRASVESAAKDLGISAQEAINLGIGGSNALPQTITQMMLQAKPGAESAGKTIGSSSGTATSGNFLSEMGVRLITGISNPINNAGRNASNASSRIGSTAGSTFSGSTLGVANRLIPGGLASSINSGQRGVNQGATRIGSGAGTTFSSSAGSGARGSGGAMAAAMSASSYIIQSTAFRMGHTFATTLRASISGTLNSMLGSGTARTVVRALTGFQSGGYTGNGGTSQVAGVVHGREFVFSAPAVDNIGLRNLTYLHNAAKSGRPQSVATAAPRVQEVELSPRDRQLLVDVKNAVGLKLEGDALQSFVGAGGVRTGRLGQA